MFIARCGVVNIMSSSRCPRCHCVAHKIGVLILGGLVRVKCIHMLGWRENLFIKCRFKNIDVHARQKVQ